MSFGTAWGRSRGLAKVVNGLGTQRQGSWQLGHAGPQRASRRQPAHSASCSSSSSLLLLRSPSMLSSMPRFADGPPAAAAPAAPPPPPSGCLRLLPLASRPVCSASLQAQRGRRSRIHASRTGRCHCRGPQPTAELLCRHRETLQASAELTALYPGSSTLAATASVPGWRSSNGRSPIRAWECEHAPSLVAASPRLWRDASACAANDFRPTQSAASDDASVCNHVWDHTVPGTRAKTAWHGARRHSARHTLT